MTKTGIRNMVLAMIALTMFVVAMIASYSGAFARPTLHHLTVAVAAPEQVVDAIRGQDALAVNVVGDDAAARQQVRERKADSAFVVTPAGEMKIYVAGGGGRSVATAAETVGREIAARGGFTATVEDVAPTSAADPSGTVEFYAIIFISIGASLGATAFGYIMGKVRRPATVSAAHADADGLLGSAGRCGDGLRRRRCSARCPGTPGPSSVRCGSTRWPSAGAVTGVAAAFGSAASMLLTLFLVVVGNAAAAGPVGRPLLSPLLLDVHDDRAAGLRCRAAAQHLLLRRQRRPDPAAHAGDMGCGRLSARGLATASRVNYRALYERFAGRGRAVLRPGLLSPAD